MATLIVNKNMSKKRIFIHTLLLLSTACALNKKGAESRTAMLSSTVTTGPSSTSVESGALHGVTVAGASHAEENGPSASPREPLNEDQSGGMPSSPLDSVSFRRRFEESYLSETEIEPGMDSDEREDFLDIMSLVQKDRFFEAVGLLQEHLGESASAVFDFTLANIRFQQDELDQSATAYSSAITKFPKFRRAWENLAQIHYRRGDFDKAIEALSRVIELGGGNGITYGLLGVSHSRLNNDISAESAFRMATMLDPSNKSWTVGLAESFFRQRRYADAASLFGRLIREDPGRARIWLAQGEAFARMGDATRAAENFEIVDEMGRSSVESLNNLADIYANQKLFDMAVSAYLRAMRKKPTAGVTRPLRAARFLIANAALDETEKLLAGIESAKGTELSKSESKEVLKLRARIAVARGASEEEVQILERVVKLDPLDGDALILLGRHYARHREVERASFYLERAANIEGFEASAKLAHARILVGQRKYAEALPMLKRVQDLEPRDSIERFLKLVESRTRGAGK